MKSNKSLRQRKSSLSNSRASRFLKRATLWLIAAGAVAFQVSGCTLSPPPPATPAGSAVSNTVPSKAAAARFSGCRQFFAGGEAPIVPMAPLLRELCYDHFAILQSGQTRTPVFVAQRLNHETIQDAQGGERTDKFLPDARLPRREQVELEDYKGRI